VTTRQFLTNAATLSAIMAIAAIIEAVVPMFVRGSRAPGRRVANLSLTAVVFLLNWLLSSTAAIVALAVSLQPPNLVRGFGLSTPFQIITGVVLLDFSAGYLAHRALHMLPVMWRFHQVHHSDDFVDVTTTYRTHPIETVWRFLFVIVPVWTIGIPALAVVIQRLVSAANGIFEHSNTRLWRPLDRALSLVWVTPNIHKIHHSREFAETNSNYGNVLTLYDRMLGTFTPSERAESVVYGLDDVDPGTTGSLGGLLSLPFQRDAGMSLTQKSGSGPKYIDNMPA
jgi:sterol desaturase/sphingolipid hydroxylase (fatty acid hydroxylase superfamily)